MLDQATVSGSHTFTGCQMHADATMTGLQVILLQHCQQHDTDSAAAAMQTVLGAIALNEQQVVTHMAHAGKVDTLV